MDHFICCPHLSGTPQDYNCRRVSLTYSCLICLWQLGRCLTFSDCRQQLFPSDFSFITFPYESLVHFCVKKEWEVRGSENWKWHWIFVWLCETLTDCKASDTDVINYLPALSWHHLELHMLNYGVNRFRVSSLTVLSWKLLLLVRRVSQRPTVKIHHHFWFSPPLTSHSFFTRKCTSLS